MIKVYIMDGPEEGQSFDIDAESLTIGRSAENHIQLNDRTVSRKHLKIVKREGIYYIEDLGSHNGTFIIGDKITPGTEQQVSEGVPIAIGMSLICLGKACLDGVMSVLEPIYLYNKRSETGSFQVKDRPFTAQKNMELIYKVSSVLTQASETHEVLKIILDYILDLLNRIDQASIILIDDESGKIGQVVSKTKSGSEEQTVRYSRTIVNRVLKTAKPIIMADTTEEEDVDKSESMELMRIRSVMCVPMISRSRVRGVIYLDTVDSPYGFRNEDIELFTTLGTAAAMVVENAMYQSQPNIKKDE